MLSSSLFPYIPWHSFGVGKPGKTAMAAQDNQTARLQHFMGPSIHHTLTFWSRNYFFNFSTPCIQNVNNTGTKYVIIMKQTAF